MLVRPSPQSPYNMGSSSGHQCRPEALMSACTPPELCGMYTSNRQGMRFGVGLIFFLLQFNFVWSWLRVLSIGDSIDRYLIHDWCVNSGGNFCKSFDENGWIWKPTNCTSNSSNPRSVYSLFKNTMRVYSWEISICDNFSENVTLGFLFNMQGVSPYPPWFNQHKSHFGIESYQMLSNNTAKDAFNHFQLPAFPNLFRALGGRPQAISINSYLWDTGRMLAYGGFETCNSTSKRHEWVHSWIKNASDLVDAIHEAVPTVRWMGWRMAHKISDSNPSCRLLMIDEMNHAAYRMAVSKQLHWEPWLARHPLVNDDMRDFIHPGPVPNIAHMTSLISTIKRDLKL
jgi:hypothetical protein